MDLKRELSTTLALKYLGKDFWSRPVYKDQFGRLWKDLNLGDCESLSLCSVASNDFEGEPEDQINQAYTIQEPTPISDEKKSQYRMLSRLVSDCKYYLGNGRRHPGHLYYKDEMQHIEAIKTLWNRFSAEEKPEWLTREQVTQLEKEMCGTNEG